MSRFAVVIEHRLGVVKVGPPASGPEEELDVDLGPARAQLGVTEVPIQGACDSEQRTGGARRLTRQICRSAPWVSTPNAHTEHHRIGVTRRARSAVSRACLYTGG